MIRASDKALLESIKRHEGFRSTPYMDTVNVWTIGYGTNLQAGITREQGEALMRCHVARDLEWLDSRYAWFETLTPNRQRAIVEMVYQLGRGGFTQFKRTIRALREGRYTAAAEQLADSKWFRQTPNRVEHVAELLRVG